MWPSLFGAGWVWNAVLSAALAAGVIAVIPVLVRGARRAGRHGTSADDSLQTIWHRFEEGDLTRWEFERLVSSPRAGVH
ncbi:MAG TPA: hypothetical protein VKW09_10440 [bacterium]|nr:hypothetical protein [bacterium]